MLFMTSEKVLAVLENHPHLVKDVRRIVESAPGAKARPNYVVSAVVNMTGERMDFRSVEFAEGVLSGLAHLQFHMIRKAVPTEPEDNTLVWSDQLRWWECVKHRLVTNQDEMMAHHLVNRHGLTNDEAREAMAKLWTPDPAAV